MSNLNSVGPRTARGSRQVAAKLQSRDSTFVASRRSRWWRDYAAQHGPQIIDRTLWADASWEALLKSGQEDIRRALSITGMRTGRQLTALELGCGMGRCTLGLAEHFGHVTGVDINARFIAQAKQHCHACNVTFQLVDGASLATFADASFDLVFCTEVFHYLERPVLNGYFREARRILREGGQFVFQLNVVAFGPRMLLTSATRRLLHHLGHSRWRGAPTAPEFARVYHKPRTLLQMLLISGFEVQWADWTSPRQAWFVAQRAA